MHPAMLTQGRDTTSRRATTPVAATTKASGASLRAFPWLTLLFAGGAALAFCVPEFSAALEYDRLLVVDEPWRLLGGHLVHWNGEHLFWDLLMFAALGWWIEADGRRRLLGLTLGAAAAISGYLWFAGPQWLNYRGLSGLDSALFVYAVAVLARQARRADDVVLAIGASGALVGFCGKICYETLTGSCLFVDTAAAGFTPLPSVHLVGAAVGFVAALGARAEARVPA